ncbi:response regulator [Magnetococcales bacterium HHB-1]
MSSLNLPTHFKEPINVLPLGYSSVAIALIKRAMGTEEMVFLLPPLKLNQATTEKLLSQPQPQVILLNPHTPTLDSLRLTRRIMNETPLPILVMGSDLNPDDTGSVFHLLEAGAMDILIQDNAWIGGSEDFGHTLAQRIIKLAHCGRNLPKRLANRHKLPPPSPKPPPIKALNMLIVGGEIGSLSSLKNMLAPLPANFPAPVIFIPTIDGSLRKPLADWLAQHIALKVFIAPDGIVPEAGVLYLPPANKQLIIDSQGQLIHQTPTLNNPSLSEVMISAANHLGMTVAGVLLSGTGENGLRGVSAIREVGGMTLTVDPDAAIAPMLPERAIRMDVVEHTIHPLLLGDTILTLSALDDLEGDQEMTKPTELPDQAIKLLIVEDSRTQAFQLKRTLIKAGYQVEVAEDGKVGLEKARSTTPELIISDVSMPRMNGFEMCRAIKDDPDLKTIPVILLTALSHPAEILEGLAAGADNYLTKPWEAKLLLNHIETLLNEIGQEGATPLDGIEITFEGRSYLITSTRKQIISLLLTTYQRTVAQTAALRDGQLELKTLNQRLMEQANRQQHLNSRLEEEAKRKEEILKQLEEQNRALSDFSHVISHDLKSPIRGLGALGEWLSQDHAHQLNEAGQELVSLVTTRANRVNQLIDELYNYTNLTINKADLQTINLNSIINNVLQQYDIPADISLEIDSNLGSITFSPQLADLLFYHLIDNAIRHRETKELSIAIHSEHKGKELLIHVTDNGPGIDPRHHERIFGIFQTLTPQDNVETMGMGLAVSRKIVERHGGFLTINSRLGGGSIFTIHLPDRLKPHEDLDP